MHGSSVNVLLVSVASIARLHQSNRRSVSSCCALCLVGGGRASLTRSFKYATRSTSYRSATTTTPPTTIPPPGNLLLCQMTARAPQHSQGGFIYLPDKTSLPYLKQQQQQSTRHKLNIIIAHGLGTDPPTKTHLNDISYDLWRDCRVELESSSDEYLSSLEGSAGGDDQKNDTSKTKEGTTAVLYTARGHGLSNGWDQAAVKNNEKLQNHNRYASFDEEDILLAQPFTWPSLANDMAAVVNGTLEQDTKFTIFGQSMGAMTAIYYAFKEPERVQALILARPPRIWEQRQTVAQNYVQAAKDYMERQQQQDSQEGYHHLPILGASLTDLPAKEDGEKWNRLSTIPVLLLCHGDDENHPLASGPLLQGAIPHSTLHDVAADEAEARQIWPSIMSKWMIEQRLA